jgi:hypothetical protein
MTHQKLDIPSHIVMTESGDGSEIAIIGMSCRFPGAAEVV